MKNYDPKEMTLDIVILAAAGNARAIGPQWGFEATEDNMNYDDLGPMPVFEFDIVEDTPEITPEYALSALNNLDDYSRMECGIIPAGAVKVLFHFIMQHTKVTDPNDEETQRIINFFTKEYLK